MFEYGGRRGRDRIIVGFIVWNQCSSPLTLWVRIPLWRVVLDTALCDIVYQLLATGRMFSSGTLVSSTNKTDRHDITRILLKVALNPIILNMNVSQITAQYMDEYSFRRVSIRMDRISYLGNVWKGIRMLPYPSCSVVPTFHYKWPLWT
jgi:hypothetical protein